MKILVITRLFTGMADSVLTEQWNPKGLPPFYKFIEGLERRGIKGDVLLSCKRNIGSDKIAKIKRFRFNDMHLDFHILPYKRNRLIRLGVAERVQNDISHLRYAAELAKKNDYDLIYCDQFDMHFGAFFALFKKKKVVARLFGVGSILQITRGFISKFDPSLIYPSFFAPFSYIICTRDGSGERYFLSNFINKKVPYEILLNGVDAPALTVSKREVLRKYKLMENCPIILFVGKMENQKGCIEFVEAMIELDSANRNFYAIMVGGGPLLASLKERVANKGLTEKIIFTGPINHDDVYNYYNASDIYVSLNKLGNISNTTLEAINAGKCVFVLSPSKEWHSDKDTHEVIPLDTAIRVDRDDIVRSLSEELNKLLRDKEIIRHYSEKSKELSQKILKSWEERIDHELDILATVAGAETQ